MKSYQGLRKTFFSVIAAIICLSFICFGGVGGLLTTVNAAPQTVKTNITNLRIENLSHQTPNSIWFADRFYLGMDWETDPDTIVHEGDYFTVELPDSMVFHDGLVSTFGLTDETGAVVAQATVNPGANGRGGSVTVTFTAAADNKYKVHGNMFLSAQFSREYVQMNENNTFTVTVGSEVISTDIVVNGPKVLENEHLNKWGVKDTESDYQAQWYARINHTKDDLGNVVITDTLGDQDAVYLADSFVLHNIEYDPTGTTYTLGSEIDISNALEISADGKSFTLNLGYVGPKQLRLSYKTTYTPKTQLNNNMRMTTNKGNWIGSGVHISQDAGGSGSGTLANKIKLIKVSARDESILLAGAVFEVTRPNGTTFTMETDQNGEAVSGSLVKGIYKVKEVTAPSGYLPSEEEYTLEVKDGEATIQTIENEPVTIEIPVEKKWLGPPLSEVVVHLFADGADTGKSITLSRDNGYTGAFTDLLKYDGAGKEISYSVEEEHYYGYTPEYSGDMQNGFVITNTLEMTQVKVEKRWIGPMPEAPPISEDNPTGELYIVVNLYEDGFPSRQVFLNEGNNWTYEFLWLRKYDPNDGHEIIYTVDEVNVPDGYEKEIDGFIIKNKNTEKIEINVTKVWIGPEDGRSPVTVYLYEGDTQTDKSLILDESNNWSGAFTGLFKYDQTTGEEIEYRISEEEIPDYVSEVTGDQNNGFTITNKNVEKTEVKGKKVWDDNDDQDGIRPARVTVRLFENGTEKESRVLTEEGNWEYIFANLPKYDDNGALIDYTVKEDPEEGYTAEYDGYNITNVHDPSKVNIKVTKVWDDENDRDGIRPESVTVHLFADGADTGKTVVLNKANNWAAEFADLDEFANKEKIIYTIEEDAVEKYTTVISGDPEEGFTVKNTHTPEPPKDPGTKKESPKTGDNSGLLLYGLLLAASLAAACTAIVIRKKRREKEDI